MDLETYPNTGLPTINAQHVKIHNERLSSMPIEQLTPSRLASALIWFTGTRGAIHYIITLDLNYDEKARDACYCHRRNFG
jgi:hypothetical protein